MNICVCCVCGCVRRGSYHPLQERMSPPLHPPPPLMYLDKNSIGASLLIRGKKNAASDVLPELKSNQTLKVYASLDDVCVRPLLGPAFFPPEVFTRLRDFSLKLFLSSYKI